MLGMRSPLCSRQSVGYNLSVPQPAMARLTQLANSIVLDGSMPTAWSARMFEHCSCVYLPKMDRVMLFELSGCLDGHARWVFSSKTLLDRICSHVVWATTCFASIHWRDVKWRRV
jgi:hypothetical protein